MLFELALRKLGVKLTNKDTLQEKASQQFQ
jgi:hypothetical protein